MAMAQAEESDALEWRNQSNTKSIKDTWLYAFKQSLFTDMIFFVGEEGTTVKCHSVILNLQSPAFQKKYLPNPSDLIKLNLEVKVPTYEPQYFLLFLEVCLLLLLHEINLSITLLIGIYYTVFVCRRTSANMGTSGFHTEDCPRFSSAKAG